MIAFLATFLALQATAPELAAPHYPAMAFRGGNVAAIIEAGKRSSGITILYADEPYREPVVETLSRWPKDKPTLIVVNFKSWPDMDNVENGIKLKPAIRKIDCPQKNRSLPVPRVIVDPMMPDPLLGDVYGSIILRLRVSEFGAVKDVDIVQGVEEYNGVVIEAARQWKFLPARNEAGDSVESEAYGICVYRLLNAR